MTPNKYLYALLLAGYIALAYIFSSFSPQAQVVSLWPPAGIALAGCLLFGTRFLPAIFSGSLIFNSGIQLWSTGNIEGGMVLQAAGIALGSTLQAFVNYKILKALSPNLNNYLSYRAVIIFISAAFACCFISAFIGNTILSHGNEHELGELIRWNNILVWWMGDFLGVILVTPILLCLLQPPRHIKRLTLVRNIVIPMLLIITILQISQQYIEHEISESAKNKFELKAKAAENSLKNQLNAYVDALNKLEAELSQEISINNEQFAQLVTPLMAKLPGIKAMSWNPVVEHKDLARFLQFSRATIDPEFNIKGDPLTPDDPLVVVQLIEPLDQNKGAQGFNVYSNQDRKDSMLRAFNSQAATATNAIQLVQVDQETPGFLIFKPVFSDSLQKSLNADTAPALRGFAVAVFLVPAIIQQALNDQLFQYIDLYIYENDNPSNRVFGDQNIIHATSTEGELDYEFELKFAQHQWNIILHLNQSTTRALQVNTALYFLAVEILLAILATFIVLTSYGRHEHLRQLVELRTKELKHANFQLEHYAFFDSLTDLPNRRFFIERAQHAINLAARNQLKVALLFMDLNKFKRINDDLGHEAGDQLLIEVSKRFKSVLRESDTLARLGGDEFTLLAESSTNHEEALAIAQKLIGGLQQPIQLAGKSISASTSIGISIFPTDADNIDDLLRTADIAMYQAKNSATGICFYSEGLKSVTLLNNASATP